jgi:hypothetical protein
MRLELQGVLRQVLGLSDDELLPVGKDVFRGKQVSTVARAPSMPSHAGTFVATAGFTGVLPSGGANVLAL